MATPRLPTRIKRRARARTRLGWARSERATVGLATVAFAGAGAVIVDQFARLLARRALEERREELPIGLAPAAAAKDTVAVAVSGYTIAPRSETVLFNLLAGFLGSFAIVRLSTWGIRDRWGPFRNVHIGGHHVHHFVPGILLAFGSGITALVTDDDELEQRLAIPMGVGIGLTFDEAALLLDLRDVYWTREGLLSVQLSLGATAILSIAILTQRMLRRGERKQEEEGLIPSAGGQLSFATGANL
ncbi:MAG TPA: hypothetical protein VGO24_04475 [Solirubrobacterales bacterium]|nr:hypothetical protein [Solirubrobacterales bacterium]